MPQYARDIMIEAHVNSEGGGTLFAGRKWIKTSDNLNSEFNSDICVTFIIDDNCNNFYKL